MLKDYVSIKEFAELTGKSQQAIYQQLNKKLKPFVKVVENKKMVQIKAIKEVYGIEVEQDIQENIKPELNQIEAELIAMLKAELEAKNKELDAKNKQIDNLQKLLDQEQQLRLVADRKLLQLEEKKEEIQQEQPIETPPEPTGKKSFFRKIFGR